MMKAFFSRALLPLVAAFALMGNASAEALHAIRIGVPDQSAGSKPFIEGRSLTWRSPAPRALKPWRI